MRTRRPTVSWRRARALSRGDHDFGTRAGSFGTCFVEFTFRYPRQSRNPALQGYRRGSAFATGHNVTVVARARMVATCFGLVVAGVTGSATESPVDGWSYAHNLDIAK